METIGIGSRVEHPHYGKGVVVETGSEFSLIWFKTLNSAKTIAKDYAELTVLERSASPEGETADRISLADIEQALDSVLNQRLHEFQLVPMAAKWNDGTLVMKPKDDELQAKEVPIEVFFHKIVMVRDRLRLIEQKINAHKVLTEGEKIELQQYITACYGSFTTFNILFKDGKGFGK